MFRHSLMAAVAGLALTATQAGAKTIDNIGVTMGSLGNPYFVALVKGITAQARKDNPSARVTSVSADYDLNKQFTQIDNFIASGVGAIVINAADPNAILPAIKRAENAGIVVVAADVGANGADATVMTDNVAAGRLSCEALIKDIDGHGNVIIENGPQVTAVTDRVKGCKEVLAKHPEVKVLSDDQDAKGSREGGLAVMQGYLIRYPDIAGVFAINDPEAIGGELAAKQSHRTLVITSVDGSPDVISALQAPGALIKATASQDPYRMGQLAIQAAEQIANGHPPANKVELMAPRLITKDNVNTYTGWTQH